MTSNVEEMKLHIKAVINKEKTKVLFVEAGSDFTDVLFSFLLLPLGTIVKIMDKHYGVEAPVIGSLNTLYNGVVNLSSNHFHSESAKQKLLVHTAIYYENELRKLRVNICSDKPTSFDYRGSYDGLYTEGAASFIISDDLRVMPNVADSFMETLKYLGISAADVDNAETRDVTFEMNEIVALLSGLLIFKNPLTALICGREMGLPSLIYNQGSSLVHQIDPKVASKNPWKTTLKVTMHKPTDKLLFAQAGHDFINFLFRALTMSLGTVEWYLGSNTGVGSMDNLHGSIADDSKKVILKNSVPKILLVRSGLPINDYVSSNEFSRLSMDQGTIQHVTGVRMYMVSDDLTVTALSMTSCFSVLRGLEISVSDVEDVEVQVGLEEGLSIVKAALTSTTALSDGLIKPFMKKAPLALSDELVDQSLSKRPKLERLEC